MWQFKNYKKLRKFEKNYEIPLTIDKLKMHLAVQEKVFANLFTILYVNPLIYDYRSIRVLGSRSK